MPIAPFELAILRLLAANRNASHQSGQAISFNAPSAPFGGNETAVVKLETVRRSLAGETDPRASPASI